MHVQWFPGHMAKTKRMIQEQIKLVDVVIEIVDARLPVSSRNPLLEQLVADKKPRVIILNKEDLADPQRTAPTCPASPRVRRLSHQCLHVVSPSNTPSS